MKLGVSTFLYILLTCFSKPSFAWEHSDPCGQILGHLGSFFSSKSQEIHFGLRSPNAERVELHLFKDAKHSQSVGMYVMERDPNHPSVWRQAVSVHDAKQMQLIDSNFDGSKLEKPIYYGFRLWGPNWKHSPDWRPGTEIGFIADVDEQGNRFNPNKLVFDPRALALSHDPLFRGMEDESLYVSGPEHRWKDTGPVASKSIVLNAPEKKPSTITRPLKDDIIYEVHLRGFTKNDPTVPLSERGTFKGAARKAKYLKSLGFTAVEFLPVQEFQNETNKQKDTKGNNYWGYMTHGFFALDRRYATKRSRKQLGGVTREFQEMLEAFHREGIKVFLDVVYNHTGEGGAGGKGGELARIQSMRGIDNQGYYQLSEDKRFYYDNTGCGANFNCANPHTQDFILDSLRHFIGLGVDGFRFDLASVLGNTVQQGNSFHFEKMDPQGLLNRILRELPARSSEGGLGVDLIAEPWAIGGNSYQVGGFPHHDNGRFWAEWNGAYRDTMRTVLNQTSLTPGDVSNRLAGSRELYGQYGRKPFHGINFIVAHDGFTNADLFRYNDKQNAQRAPWGPSDGGEDNNRSWDQAIAGDTFQQTLARQRQAARNGYALPLISFGVPMITGGDEFLRTQRGNNNMYNVDSRGSWIDWRDKDKNNRFFHFAKHLTRFRNSRPAMKIENHFDGKERWNGLRDIAWLRADGQSAEGKEYMDNGANTFLAYRLNTEGTHENERSIYVGYNYGPYGTVLRLPPTAPGKQWYWVGDTSAYYEKRGNFMPAGKEIPLSKLIPEGHGNYTIDSRAIVLFVEK